MQIQNLAMNFGERVLFQDVNLQFNAGSRYGVVGANGAGKTTFLNILAGNVTASDGAITKERTAKIGFMKQDQFYYDKFRVIDVVIAGKERLFQALKRKEALLSQAELTDDEAMDIANQEIVIAEENGYCAEADAATLLTGLGIDLKYHEQPLSALSGGFKLRSLLAQLLFQAPEIMLLDEPTNHLDIETIAWLENYLMENFNGILIFISHDRAFLNRLSTHIIDVDYKTAINYPGNYDHFEDVKQLNHDLRVKTRENQEKQVAHLQEFVDKFKAKASKAKQAQSKLKQIEKIDLTTVHATTRMAPKFNFACKRESGKAIVQINNIHKAFAEKQVLTNVNFDVFKGDKIALIGANGLGKSTLLKILTERHQADQGSVEWGANINLAYFAQDHHEMLNRKCSVLQWLEDEASQVSSQAVRNMLGQVLFSKDDVDKSILSLSGGEAARLLLANVMLQQGNVLLLDEPTNHLDMETVDALAQAIKQSKATVIVVSHDRYFLNQFANRVVCLRPDGILMLNDTLEQFNQKYQQALEGRQPSQQTQVATPKTKKVELDRGQQRKLQTRVKTIETKIAELEVEKEAIEAALTDDNLYLPEQKAQLSKHHAKQAKIVAAIEDAYQQWEELMAQMG